MPIGFQISIGYPSNMTKNHFQQLNNIINQICSQFNIIHNLKFNKYLKKYTCPLTSNILNMTKIHVYMSQHENKYMTTNTCVLLAFCLLILIQV
jgi:hypothetical protein